MFVASYLALPSPTATRMWQVCLPIVLPRPLARADIRRSVAPLSTKIVVTLSSSMSAPSLCSALAIADSSTLRMMRAPFLVLKASTSSALSTGSPRTWSATSRPFWADSRTPRRVATVSIARSLPALRRLRRRCHLLVGRMALEGARQRELAELVPDHVLGHVDGNVLLAVVHGDREPDEVRRDRRAPRPGLDRLLVVDRARGFHLRLQVAVDERALLD